MARSLQGKSIIITGASSGIGKATALACGEADMRVVLAARRREALEAVADAVRTRGGEAHAVQCDVDRDEDVTRLFDTAVDAVGTIDVVFANAGYGLYGAVVDTTDEQARAIFETNFWGTVRCIQAAAPLMTAQRHGQIIICSSACSEISLPMYGMYAATKAAQDSLAGALRAELSDTGVTVTTVHPIGTSSEFFPNIKERFNPPGGGLNTPDELMQTPEHVARCIVRAIRKPRHEVWPSGLTRLGLALTTASPLLSAFVGRRLFAKRSDVPTGDSA